MLPSDKIELLRSCRLCLSQEQHVDLFGKYCQTKLQYAEMVNHLLGFVIARDQRLSERICMECTSSLVLFHKFREKCEQANNRITELITFDVKSHITESQHIVLANGTEVEAANLGQQVEDVQSCDDIKVKLNSHIIENNEYEADATVITETNAAEPTTYIIETPLAINKWGTINHCLNNDSIDSTDTIETNIAEYLMEEVVTTSPQSIAHVETAASVIDGIDANLHYDNSSSSNHIALTGGNSPALSQPTCLLEPNGIIDDDRPLASNAEEFGFRSLTADTFVDSPAPSASEHAEPSSAPAPPHTNEHQFACDECGRSFGRLSVLKQHRNTHTGQKNYECNICEARFTRKSHVLQHMRIHTNQKPHRCDVCHRQFGKRFDLRRHERVHSDERAFACAVCAKRFKRLTDLQSHRSVHTGERRYVCPFEDCTKAYTSHSSLKEHRQRMHRATEATDEEEALTHIVDVLVDEYLD